MNTKTLTRHILCLSLSLLLVLGALAGCGTNASDKKTEGSNVPAETAAKETAAEPSGEADAKQELTPVTLSEVAHSIFYAPQYAAIELGYFEEEGIDLTLINSAGAEVIGKACEELERGGVGVERAAAVGRAVVGHVPHDGRLDAEGERGCEGEVEVKTGFGSEVVVVGAGRFVAVVMSPAEAEHGFDAEFAGGVVAAEECGQVKSAVDAYVAVVDCCGALGAVPARCVHSCETFRAEGE